MVTTVVNIIIITIIMVIDYDYYGMMIIIIIPKELIHYIKIKVIIFNTYVRKLDNIHSIKREKKIIKLHTH